MKSRKIKKFVTVMTLVISLIAVQTLELVVFASTESTPDLSNPDVTVSDWNGLAEAYSTAEDGTVIAIDSRIYVNGGAFQLGSEADPKQVYLVRKSGSAGIYITNTANLTIYNMIIDGNKGTISGDYPMLHVEGALNLHYSVVQNSDTFGETGTIYIANSATFFSVGTTYRNNSAAIGGHIVSAGTTILNGCILENGNGREYGGAIHVSSGTTTIENCKIIGNQAGNWGGGLCNYGGNVTISQSVIYGNTANYGSDIANDVNSEFQMDNLEVVMSLYEAEGITPDAWILDGLEEGETNSAVTDRFNLLNPYSLMKLSCKDETTEDTGGSDDSANTEDGDTSGDDTGTDDGTGDTGNTENPDDTEDTGNTENPDDTEDTGNTENPDDTEDTGNTENPDDTEDTGNTENPDDSEDTGSTENPDDTGNNDDTGEPSTPGDGGSSEDEGNDDTGNSEDSGSTENPDDTEDGSDVEDGGTGDDSGTTDDSGNQDSSTDGSGDNTDSGNQDDTTGGSDNDDTQNDTSDDKSDTVSGGDVTNNYDQSSTTTTTTTTEDNSSVSNTDTYEDKSSHTNTTTTTNNYYTYNTPQGSNTTEKASGTKTANTTTSTAGAGQKSETVSENSTSQNTSMQIPDNLTLDLHGVDVSYEIVDGVPKIVISNDKVTEQIATEQTTSETTIQTQEPMSGNAINTASVTADSENNSASINWYEIVKMALLASILIVVIYKPSAKKGTITAVD